MKGACSQLTLISIRRSTLYHSCLYLFTFGKCPCVYMSSELPIFNNSIKSVSGDNVLARLFSGGAAPLGCYIASLGFHNFYCDPSDDYQILAILSGQDQ